MASREVIRIPERIVNQLLNAHYGVYNHSTVEICHWTKKSVKNQGVCYKRVFYGIDSHRCVEFSPAGMMCTMKCIFCWRPMEFMKKVDMSYDEVDDPVDIMEGLMRERARLMSGYPGMPHVDFRRLEEAKEPTHYAISLSGEPTLYPRLPELVKYLKSLPSTRSVYIVSNGLQPDMIKRMMDEDALPTQLYISMSAPNEEVMFKIDKPLYKDAWKRYLKSLELLSMTDTRTVIRMTMIKDVNALDEYIPEYVELLEIANPHFIEVKSYMHLGFSTKRLKKSNMMRHEEIRRYARKILRRLKGFRYMDEYPPSRIAVLQNMVRYVDRWIP